MVLEEDNSKNSYAHRKAATHSKDQQQLEDFDDKKRIEKEEQNQELAGGLSPSAEEEFDFQFIEEESDRPIDIAIKRLTEIINSHKIQIRIQKEQRNAAGQSSA